MLYTRNGAGTYDLQIKVMDGKISTENPFSEIDVVWKKFISDECANTWLLDDKNRHRIEKKT